VSATSESAAERVSPATVSLGIPDAAIVFGVGLVVRLLVVAWAANTFPPTADGTYYHQVATRIAEGHGYTWLWPDGAVTYAAHYPVGYPALVALGYAIFGARPVVAMSLNALIGAGGAVAVGSLVKQSGSRRLALGGGLAVAIHPVLVPYTAAIMTEGVTAALLAIAAALAALAARTGDRTRRLRSLVLVGLVAGAVTLVRPQSLVFAPILGWLAAARPSPSPGRLPWHRHPAFAAALVSAFALAVCAPWTARNCLRMERCALVSVNGGWNLAIGAQTNTGGWQEIAVPDACRTVFQEAAKDECFGREARKVILDAPGAWLARAPAKLRATFDYFGAAPWYLNTANPKRFDHDAKVALGAVETLAARLFLVAALVALLRYPVTGGAPRLRRAAAILGLVASVLVPGTVGYLALVVAIGSLGRCALRQAPLIVPFTGLVILATAATHTVFFGSGRYGLVVVPFVTALAFVRIRSPGIRQAEAPRLDDAT
jgi:4-amino-4-deoxy-L-arabinose transferase-like glycosyltransferase